jgi:lipopolysaccharide/colanic/teichoic acid biosynthesis glycosyltransferase
VNSTSVKPTSRATDIPFDWPSLAKTEVLDESSFQRLVALERKRSERTEQPLLLMLLKAGERQATESEASLLDTVARALACHGRETDVVGWFNDNTAIGVLFTGFDAQDRNQAISAILNRVKDSLRGEFMFHQLSQFSISFHFFPDQLEQSASGSADLPLFYPDLILIGRRRRPAKFVKRAMDVSVSAGLLLMLAPLLLLIGLAIKLTTKGPVFFRQIRVGQYGRCFTFLKFRSMVANNDSSIHRKFITKLIAGNAPGKDMGHPVYKMTDDKRITWIGKLLRRSSLDELPQLINVLRGDMSLVGPRPAIPYEVSAYRTWHRRRVFEAKPGLTGLWQIEGRSRVSFDEMVRMDLRYAKEWSLWLDLKILVLTPLAVLRGSGAY